MGSGHIDRLAAIFRGSDPESRNMASAQQGCRLLTECVELDLARSADLAANAVPFGLSRIAR